MARVLHREKKEAEALSELNVAEKYAPANHKIRSLRGQVLLRLGRKEEGEAELAEAKRLFNKIMEKDRERVDEKRVPNPEIGREE
jgi:Flp pilus assembly protein TadD